MIERFPDKINTIHNHFFDLWSGLLLDLPCCPLTAAYETDCTHFEHSLLCLHLFSKHSCEMFYGTLLLHSITNCKCKPINYFRRYFYHILRFIAAYGNSRKRDI